VVGLAKTIPKSWARLNTCSTLLICLDRRDVERELEGDADTDGPAFEVVGVGRRVLAAEIGRGIHQHRARGHRLVVERGQVVERLERRPRLAETAADDVVLRLELLVALGRVVVRAADVGDQLTGLVVDGDEGAVVDVLATEILDPLGKGAGKPEGLVAGGRILVVRDESGGLDPLLGDLLDAGIEGRGDPQATGLEDRAGRDPDPADLVGQLGLDRPDEMRGDPERGDLRGHDDRLVLGGAKDVGAELALGKRSAPLGEELEDLVPALDDRAVVRHDELRLVRGQGALRLGIQRARVHALLDGVLDEVVVRR
jgi:hypothetical protein